MKELRLRNINSIKDANAYMPEFMADYNAKFGKEPRNDKDMHRPFSEHDRLDGAMSFDALPRADTAPRQGAVHSRAIRVLNRTGPQACDDLRLSRLSTGDSVRSRHPAL